MLIVIEGDNGTGKTTLGNLLKNYGYNVISEEPEVIAMSKEFKKYPAGSIERFNAFVGFNEYCLEKCKNIKNADLIRSWISTVSAAYADGLMTMEDAKKTAEKFLVQYPIPDLIIRLQCEYSVRIQRIKERSLKDNDKSDDITSSRNNKYQEILEIMQSFFPNWINLDSSEKNPDVILKEVLSMINR